MQPESAQLPAGWQAAFDSRYHRWYYVHAASGTSQWEQPAATQQQQQQQQQTTDGRATSGPQASAEAAGKAAGAPTAVQQPDAAAATSQPEEVAAGTGCPQQQQQQQDSAVQSRGSMYCYRDPWGRLMGPFTVDQFRAWRAYLPMDLLLLPPQQQQQTAAADSSREALQPTGDAPAAAAVAGDATGPTAAAEAAETNAIRDVLLEQQQTACRFPERGNPIATAEQAFAAGGAAASQDRDPHGSADVPAQTAATAGADAAEPASGTGNMTAAAAAAAAVVYGHEGSSSSRGSKSSAASVYLADLLGDTALLKHFQTSQQQQQQQQQQQKTQQEGRGSPDKAVAPPAPVWQAWVAQHTSTAANGSAAATAAAAQPVATAAVSGAALPAAAGWYLQHQQQYQQHQQQYQQLPLSWQQQQGPLPRLGSLAGANSSSGGGSGGAKSSSFNKYAAAVLQGLPPEDEVVQLAQMAAVHGYSLSDVLQQQQQRAGTSVGSAGGITVTPDGVSALLVKDPRSGRLSVAPGNAGDGITGGSSAAELYGDMARWCDPASLERTLQRKRQQQEQQAVRGPGASGGSGGAVKRTRLASS